jgi:iron(III) transport system ATP-binding protein
MTGIILSDVTLPGDRRPRLDRVSLTIGNSSRVSSCAAFRTAIVGYSGAGKTSLLNVIAQFEEPSTGMVDRRRNDGSAESRRLPLYWVPQNGGLWNHLTVQQHLITVGGEVTACDQLLQALDLLDRGQAFPAELSQGERSRVALARALCANAELLVMDEPLSHVDPVRKPRYWNVIAEWLDRDKTSLIFSSHEPETVLQWSHDVICLHEGRVVHHGDTKTLYHQPPNEQAGQFLGPLNWFTQEECLMLLDLQEASRNGLPVRPEKIELVCAVDGTSEVDVVGSHFGGSSSQSVVRHRGTGKTRTVTHGSNLAILPGSLVKVKLIRHDSKN